MSLEEIRKEIDKDFPILKRKMGFVAHDLTKKLSKEQLKAGFGVFYYYTSKYKNQWLYRIFVTKKENMFGAILFYHNKLGIVAIGVSTELHIMYHTRHFFARYNERLHLGLDSLDEIVRAYMNMEINVNIQELEELEPGIMTIFCTIKSGVILGVYHRDLKLIKANTFITYEMMRKDQRKIEEYLKERYSTYKQTSSVVD